MIGDVPTDPRKPTVCGGLPPPQTHKERQTVMNVKDQIENEPVEVAWSEEPLDVSLEKHGNKKPDRKVKVRGILRDAWLEKEAGLEAGSVKRLMEAITKALRHGYEPRMAESVRFVHMVDANFTNMRVSVQPMGSFRNCLEGVSFRLRYGEREMSAEEADGLREPDSGEEEAESEVSPDQMITCPKCHKRFRVGKKQG